MDHSKVTWDPGSSVQIPSKGKLERELMGEDERHSCDLVRQDERSARKPYRLSQQKSKGCAKYLPATRATAMS